MMTYIIFAVLLLLALMVGFVAGVIAYRRLRLRDHVMQAVAQLQPLFNGIGQYHEEVDEMQLQAAFRNAYATNAAQQVPQEVLPALIRQISAEHVLWLGRLPAESRERIIAAQQAYLDPVVQGAMINLHRRVSAREARFFGR